MITTRAQYDRTVATFVSWLNWEGSTNVGGLLLGLADYYVEIRLMEAELMMPEEQRFKVRAAMGRVWNGIRRVA